MGEDIALLDAVRCVRKNLTDGLGVTIAFIDDHAALAVALAQRAVLAGLASDAEPDMRDRLRSAAEAHRSSHEKALGHPICNAAAAPDMAEACRMLVESYDADMGTYALGKLYEAREAARAALSKAKGETE